MASSTRGESESRSHANDLREREERYRTLFEAMGEAYAVVEVLADAEGRWTDFLFPEVNPAFMRRTGMPYPVGRTATEILGTPRRSRRRESRPRPSSFEPSRASGSASTWWAARSPWSRACRTAR